MVPVAKFRVVGTNIARQNTAIEIVIEKGEARDISSMEKGCRIEDN